MVYVLVAVSPFTLTTWEPAPSSPALLTVAAEPEDMPRTCVKLRVVSGTAVIVLLVTKVPDADAAALATVHSHATRCDGSPASNLALTTVTSETYTMTE